MWIRCICLTSRVHMVYSMFSMDEVNKNKRESVKEIISFPSKRQRVDETMETSLFKNVLGGNEQRKWMKQGTSKYLEERISRGNPDLVKDNTTDNRDDIHEIASEEVHKVEIEQHVEELLNDRKTAIKKDNNPASAYYLIETYLKSVFGKTDEHVENGKIDYATRLLDWFSDYINVQKLELKRYDLTRGFIRALLSIFGFSEIAVSGRHEGLVTTRYWKRYNDDDNKTDHSRNTNEDSHKKRDYLRNSIPHVNTVYIPSHKFAASFTKKGLDRTKIYDVLTAWLRETKVERFIYYWEVRHKNMSYSCKIYHNLSKEKDEDIIAVNIWKDTPIDANYKDKLSENYFPFVRSRATNFKIIVGCYITFDPSFIYGLLGNTPVSKFEIIFLQRIVFYEFYHENKRYDKIWKFEYGVKLNNNGLFPSDLQEFNDLRPIRYVFWDLDTKVSKMDISFLKNLRAVFETGNTKGLKRFTIVFPNDDSKLETVAAFFKVFGSNNERISEDSYKRLQDSLRKYIELDTLEDLNFLNKNLQQLYITLDTVIKDKQGTPIKQLEVHFMYEGVTSSEKTILEINNFAINRYEMTLIYKMKVDKLNFRDVIFRWSRNDKECLDVMEPDKESRWYGKVYSENARYTMTEEERKEIEIERNKILRKIRSSYSNQGCKLKRRSVKFSFSVSRLNEEKSKLELERNNEILETYEEYKTLWENIPVEWIINGLDYFGKNKNLATTSASHVSVPDSDDGYAFFTYLGLD